jgi:hypothetical protein
MERVFISHSSRDAETAKRICAALEGRGFKCWISTRDIVPGLCYAEAIIDAINAASLVLLVLSPASNGSRAVRKEIERSFGKDLPILTYEQAEVETLHGALEFFLSEDQWFRGSAGDFEELMDQTASSIATVLEVKGPVKPPEPERVPPPADRAPRQPLWVPSVGASTRIRIQLGNDASDQLSLRLLDAFGRQLVPAHQVTIPDDLRPEGDELSEGRREELGRRLFECLFSAEAQDLLAANSQPLLVQAEDTSLPWEFLHDGCGFLCTRQPLTLLPPAFSFAEKIFKSPQAGASVPEGGRVLVVSDPDDSHPQAQAEGRALVDFFRAQGLLVDDLSGRENGSFLKVMECLRKHRYDLLYFACGLQFLPERGSSALLLANDQCLTADELCGLIQGTPLAVFDGYYQEVEAEEEDNETDAGPDAAARGMRALAQALAHGNIHGRAKVVVGPMRCLDQDVAPGFANQLFQRLWAGDSIGEAVLGARRRTAGQAGTGGGWLGLCVFGDADWRLGSRVVALGQPPAEDENEISSDLQGLAGGLPWADDMRVAMLDALSANVAMNWSALNTLHMLAGLIKIKGGIINGLLREQGYDPSGVRRGLREVLARWKPKQGGVGPGQDSCRLSANLGTALATSKELAGDGGALQVEEKHFLQALLGLESTGALMILKQFKIIPEDIRERLKGQPGVKMPPASDGGGAEALEPLFREDGRLNSRAFERPAWDMVLNGAKAAAQGGWNQLRSPHLFLGALLEPNSNLCRRLRDMGQDPRRLLAIFHSTTLQSKQPAPTPPELTEAAISSNANAVLRSAWTIASKRSVPGISEDSLVRAMVLDESSFVAKTLKRLRIEGSDLVSG